MFVLCNMFCLSSLSECHTVSLFRVTELVLVFAEVMGVKNMLIIHKGLREFVQSLVQKRKEQIELVLTPWDFRSTEDPLR